ncbi:Indoleamine 2,3-dioxygenase [Pisolithus marmoratus]|nr:Indoleamine 2,3-dioxygenase [Pisolithus marmoratus]
MYLIDLLPSPIHLVSDALWLLRSFQATRRASPEVQPSPSDFDVNIRTNTGFLPASPLPNLQGPYDIWETALAEAPGVLKLGETLISAPAEERTAGEAWRQRIRSMPILPTNMLMEDPMVLRRAHQVLAFLVHFYVHSIPSDSTTGHILVPRSLVAPFMAVSAALEIAPVLTYADTVLWNWELIDPKLPVTFENMRFGRHLFSGSDAERNFYYGSARTELVAVEVLHIIHEYHNLPNVTDFQSVCKIKKLLERLAVSIEDINSSIQAMKEEVDPLMFYWEARPWWNGSGSGPDAPSWIYEGIGDTSKLDLSGPSAGQSTAMHAIDLFLDIDHKLQQRRYPAPSQENKRADHGFMDRMRRYMPGGHRKYLEWIAKSPRPVRSVAQDTPVIREHYNAAVSALRKLRDLHIRVACLYVVSMSHTRPPPTCPVSAVLRRMEREAARQGPATGTGGNELSVLLKAGRDATTRAVLKTN